ncbi:MAG: dihydropteroate synthase [Treponema sp.]
MLLQLTCGSGFSIETTLPAYIMGIVNTTPDSFFSKSCSSDMQKNLERVLLLAEQGADIIDIGGESSRPGAVYISEEEEMTRVIPLIEAVRKRSSIPLSIDTRKAAVMQAAFKAGAEICNDISALTDDPALPAVIARCKGAVVLMHKNGIPATMQQQLSCRRQNQQHIVQEVLHYLQERANYAQSCGIPKDCIMIDYGIGFGKTAEDNVRLISASAQFADLGYPLLVGLSRKSFIGHITGEPVEQRLTGSLAAAQYAVQNGASILRVHDVAETRSMLLVLKELQKYGTH